LIEDGHYLPKRYYKQSNLFDFGLFRRQSNVEGLNQAEVRYSRFIPMGNRFISKDFVQGTIDGVRFLSSDVYTANVSKRSDGKSSTTQLFNGRVFEFSKPIDGHVLALEKFKPNEKRKNENLDTESVDFNKKFNTYATKPQLAFYILTPQLMEMLMELEQNPPGQIGFSFIKNRLFIALNTGRGTFEFARYRPIDERYFDGIKKDLDVLKTFVEKLKLSDTFYKAQEEASDEHKDLLEADMPEDLLAPAIVEAMEVKITTDDKGKVKKELLETEESKRLYERKKATAKDAEIKALDMQVSLLKRMRLQRTDKNGEMTKYPLGCGCGMVLLVAVSILFLLILASLL